MTFKLIDNLKFVNVDMQYLMELHKISHEVYYNQHNYDNKPYLGILLSADNYKYVIPLTSAKEKHKKWRIEEVDRFLIYEIINKELMIGDDIWIDVDKQTENSGKKVYHIWSAIDLKKMIPVVDSVITEVDINIESKDTIENIKYKNLLINEYNFCLKIIDKILIKASRVYEKQTKTKKGLKFCCDFKALEKFVVQYK